MNTMLKTERQEKILAEISEKNTISITDLTANFDVSEITIRRDLDDLDRLGKIQRIRGGARRLGLNTAEPPVIHRQLEQVDEKEAIAAKALEFIHDGEIIALESGSTTLWLARAISRRAWQNLQVVTNSITILNLLLAQPGIRMIFLGGFADSNEMCTYGKLTEEALSHLHIDKYFCGCRGLDPHFGRSNEIQTGIEIGTVRAYAAAANQIFVLADHTKFGRVFALQLLPTSGMDVIVTTTLTPAEYLQEITSLGKQVIIARLPTANSQAGAPPAP